MTALSSGKNHPNNNSQKPCRKRFAKRRIFARQNVQMDSFRLGSLLIAQNMVQPALPPGVYCVETKKDETMKRQRGRNRNKSNHNNNNRSMDSNGPDVKVRGTASTIYEKYTALARDAASSGSRVKAENYRQHAEHYLRLMNIQEAAKQAAQEEREAARAAREEAGESGDEDDNRGRRNGRSRRDKSEDKAETAKEEIVADTAEASKSDTDNSDVTEEAPKRRRRAPSRKAAETEAAAVDAAE